MPFNGAGVYSPPGADFPAVTQTVISSTHYNNIVTDIATALSLCLTKDGQQTATANIPFGGFRATNVGITGIAGSVGTPAINVSDSGTGLYRSASNELAVTVAETQRGRFDSTGLIVTGTVNASTSMVTPTIGATAADLQIATGSGIIFQTDNAKDVGASGATRPRTGYFGTSVVIAGQAFTANGAIAAITYVFDGGGATLTTGVKGDLLIPFACTINSATLEADQSGSIVIDIWKKTYTLDSPPAVAQTITASAKPTLASHQSSQDATLTGWTTSIAANDMLRFNIDSITTCQRVTLTLKVTKT